TGELRWLGGALGPARNLDVFATELLPVARSRLPDEAGWDDLASTLDRLRSVTYDQIKEAVLSDRYTAAMLRLLRWFAVSGGSGRLAHRGTAQTGSSVGAIAACLLDRRRRKVRHRSEGFGGLTPHQRHKLRIAVKKLRYTIELFGSVLDEDGLEKFVRRLKRLQGDL